MKGTQNVTLFRGKIVPFPMPLLGMRARIRKDAMSRVGVTRIALALLKKREIWPSEAIPSIASEKLVTQ